MRRKRDWRSGSKEAYNEFCNTYKGISITYEQYYNIIVSWNTMFAMHIIETGERLKMPFGLGPLGINKRKAKAYKKNCHGDTVIGYAVDWVKSKQEGRKIFLMNHHTEGYRYNFKWFPKEAKIKCHYIWAFKIFRSHSRLLAKYLKTPDNTYKDIYKEW